MPSEEIWQTRLDRERAARKQAEQLLETKARELYLRNRELAELAESLEARVAARTAELEAALVEADAAGRARLAFLAMVSHELRTPLNAIIGGLELLGGGRLEADQRDQLDMVGGSAEALLRLIDDILGLAALESGKISIEARPFDCAALLEEAVESFRLQAARKGLSLGLDTDLLQPATMTADPARIRQVAVNLIGNALKFTERGGVRIAARRLPGPALELTVTDTGPGLSDADRERLFEPFVRAGRAGRDRLDGTGLGLAICRRIATSLGGTIAMKSTLGVGSAFTFTVPVGEAAAPGPAAATEPTPPRPGRLLVVDDLPTNRIVAAAHLRRAGHSVDVAAGGAEALQAQRAAPYDIIFMDLLMPDMDGLEAMHALRAGQGPQPVVIGLTAAGLAEVREQCLAAGMQDVLVKPVTGLKLREVAARWLAP